MAWVVVWCLMLAQAIMAGVETRRWQPAVCGIVFITAAISHGVCFFLGRNVASPASRKRSSRATVTESPDFDAFAPHDAIGFYKRGVRHFENGEYDESISDYREAIRIDPQSEQLPVYENLAAAYAAKNDFDGAVAEFSRLIQLDPQNARALSLRAQTYCTQGKLDEAIADLTEVIQVDPKDGQTYNARGKLYKLTGDQAKAEADFAKAKELGYEPE
jgi:tetratricopeptide (TPR) repeat protein